MRSLFIISDIGTNPLRHYDDECAVIHVHPIVASHKLIRGISYEWAVRIKGQIRFIEAAHNANTTEGCLIK